MSTSSLNMVTATIMHDPELETTTTHLEWRAQQPTDVYTLEYGDASLQLCLHNLARPSHLLLSRQERIGTVALIESCFGPELADIMYEMRIQADIAALTLDILMNRARLIEIAKLQERSPSTPPHLRKLASLFIENRAQSPISEYS